MSNEQPHYFHADDLKHLGHLAEKVRGLATWHGTRVVVSVWDRGDQQAVAWIECHPDDSDATIRFGPELDEPESEATR